MKPKAADAYLKINTILLLQSNPQGLTLEELSQALGIQSQSQIKKLLGSLFMLGKPPYSPLDLIDIEYKNGKVKILAPFSYSSLFHIRPSEWIILRDAILEEQKKNPKQIYYSILKKIQSIVPFHTLTSYQELKSNINKAIQETSTVQFSYFQKKSKLRNINPWYLLEEDEQNPFCYLLGFCRDNQAPRVFRLDRISSLVITKEKFQPPDPSFVQNLIQNLQNFKKQIESKETAVLWHTRRVHYYLNQILSLKTYDIVKNIHGKEWIRSEFKIGDPDWVTDQIIGVLPDAILESPQWLKDKLLKEVQLAMDKFK